MVIIEKFAKRCEQSIQLQPRVGLHATQLVLKKHNASTKRQKVKENPATMLAARNPVIVNSFLDLPSGV